MRDTPADLISERFAALAFAAGGPFAAEHA
jgi:hypothetical protein